MTNHTCVFNLACAGACECDRTPFPSRPVFILIFSSFCLLSSSTTPRLVAQFSLKQLFFKEIFLLSFTRQLNYCCISHALANEIYIVIPNGKTVFWYQIIIFPTLTNTYSCLLSAIKRLLSLLTILSTATWFEPTTT